MPDVTRVDSDAVRALAHAHAGHAVDLSSVSASLATLPLAAVADALGPVGARFAAALSDAITVESAHAAALADSVGAAAVTASGCAAASSASATCRCTPAVVCTP